MKSYNPAFSSNDDVSDIEADETIVKQENDSPVWRAIAIVASITLFTVVVVGSIVVIPNAVGISDETKAPTMDVEPTEAPVPSNLFALAELVEKYSKSKSVCDVEKPKTTSAYRFMFSGDEGVEPLNQVSQNRMDEDYLCKDYLEELEKIEKQGIDQWNSKQTEVLSTLKYAVEGDIFYENNVAKIGSGGDAWLNYILSVINTPLKVTTADDAMQAAAYMKKSVTNDWLQRSIEGVKESIEYGYVPYDELVEGFYDELVLFLSETPLALFKKPLEVAATLNNDTVVEALEGAEVMLRNKVNELTVLVKEQYIPTASTETSVSKRSPFKGAYDALIKYHTATDLTAQEIHDIGLREVKRITKRMQELANKNGFTGDNAIREYQKHINAKEDETYSSPEDVLIQAYKDTLFIMPTLQKAFINLPETPFKIRSTLRPGDAANYIPSSDKTTPGIVSVRTHLYQEIKKYEMMSLMVHEGYPGHHYHLSYGNEFPLEEYTFVRKKRNLPTTSLTEGWGLYTEYLGEELGVYFTDAKLFGRFLLEIWRAIRLVVDTGLHAFDWTREQVKQYMLDNFTNSVSIAEAESMRYVRNPGQALAYKIGEIKIKETRSEAEKELGSDFDLGEFHTRLVELGRLPLPLAITHIENWVKDTKK